MTVGALSGSHRALSQPTRDLLVTEDPKVNCRVSSVVLKWRAGLFIDRLEISDIQDGFLRVIRSWIVPTLGGSCIGAAVSRFVRTRKDILGSALVHQGFNFQSIQARRKGPRILARGRQRRQRFGHDNVNGFSLSEGQWN